VRSGALFLLSFLLAASAHAFPQNVRHGYPNCTACHVSPGGGGVLSAYGRELSRELQSTWGGEKESAFLYGLVKTPEWLDAGGDLRYLQLVTDTPTRVRGTSFWMQADAEAAAHLGPRWTIDVAAGWKGNSSAVETRSDLISRRHYAIYAITDPSASGRQWTIRGGKFYPVFGIMPAEHNYSVRRGMGFDQNDESYNLELARTDENGSLTITPILGKGRSSSEPDERGIAFSRSWTIAEHHRIAFSEIYGRGVRQSRYDSRWAFGPSWVVSFSKTLFSVGELDLEFRKKPGSRNERGLYQFQKLTWEPIQGFQLSLLEDLSKSKVVDSRTLVWSWGPVLDWYPRPHLDLQLGASRVILPDPAPNFWTYTGMFHFYL
jgi:hypothetical protein